MRARTLIAAMAMAAAAALSAAAAEEKILNITNWAEYVGEKTVANFEAETGIKVRYDNFDSNEVLMAKMIAGRTGYDIIIPSSDFGRIMVDGGLVQKVDRSKLSRWSNLDPAVLLLMGKLDPGNQYMVPWLGSTVSVGYNPVMVKAALGGEPIPADPFELVFNPKYTSKLKKCGISLLDSAADLFPSALIYLGRPAFGNNATDYQDAFAMLQKVRGDIALFSYNGYIADLAAGNLCVALGYGGDFNNANAKAKAAGKDTRIEAPLPPRGTQFGFESMMIPVDAPHPENAHAWINYILRPEVQAEITNKVKFTSPNLAARKFIAADVLANKIAFPGDDYLSTKAQFYEVRKNDTRRLMTRLFTKFKTGT
ncbi:extracellular solute-binding protein [Curvibacter sp. APW13]|uniref:extracellular solute-binding protein n=1 Tax=Curvibacter sp. APW13 TaxID=3077236 RepID=UPI0028DECD7A|nr:extracellular solute-binding protein [Curvibacter sp. APW13]MDT8992324.1 extracellular solute-binding protein [Curvibacter sp. APW13]